MARRFDETIKGMRGGNWVVVFDWASSVAVRRAPDQLREDVGVCLMLAAAAHEDIPPGYMHSVGGVEFAVQIPSDILDASAHRRIDLDETQVFKLALR